MARTFFTAGLDAVARPAARGSSATCGSPADWAVDGTHYARSAEAWLRRMDENEAELRVLAVRRRRERAWLANWRVFFLACAELWGFRDGRSGASPTTCSSRELRLTLSG